MDSIAGMSLYIVAADDDERDDIRERIESAGATVLRDRYTLADYIVCCDAELNPEFAAAAAAWEIPVMSSLELIARVRLHAPPPKTPPVAACPPSPPLPFELPPRHVVERTLLLQDKYAPTSCNEICGNSAALKIVAKYFKNWDADRDERRQRHDEKAKLPPKALVLVGPPGIGKTTLVNVLAREAGYEVVECNASDVRTRDDVMDALGSITVTSQRFTEDGTETQRQCIVIEEIDGIATGGLNAVFALIERDVVPIVCIANDDQAAAVKRTKTHDSCRLVNVFPPQPDEFVSRLRKIARLEAIAVTEQQLTELVRGSRGDMRHAVVTLGLLRLLPNTSTSSMVTDADATSPFESTKQLFAPKSTFANRDRIVNEAGGDLLPLFVHENYVNSRDASIHALSAAADALSLADTCGEYGAVHECLAALVPVGYVLGTLETVEFPTALSSLSKIKRSRTQATSIEKKFRTSRAEFSALATIIDAPDVTLDALGAEFAQYDADTDDYEALTSSLALSAAKAKPATKKKRGDAVVVAPRSVTKEMKDAFERARAADDEERRRRWAAEKGKEETSSSASWW